VRHLQHHGCQLLREGGAHSVFGEPTVQKVTTVPRHKEINEFLRVESAGISKFRKI